MWRVILVDDEEFVRAELTALFPWRQFGFDFVGEAEDARAALDLINTTRPDFVITDIRMPETDGLELIAWIGQHHPQIVIAVVSAYNDFQFVREALRLGAVDYLIKAEAAPETAGALLKRVGDILENRRFTREKQEKTIINLAQFHQIATEAFWRDTLTRALDEKELELQAEQLGIDIKDNCYGLIFIHVSNGIDSTEDNQTTFRKNLEAKVKLYWEWNLIEIKQGNYVVITSQSREKLKPEMAESLERIAHQLALDFPEKLTTSASSRFCAFHELPGYFREAREANLLRLYRQTETIRKALVYIQSNFTRDLTLEEVAAHVGVSKSYLSRIFPEYAGKHFCSYLQQLRIERAKELLRFTDDHIYEIASKVGFWNSRYFGKVFRDMVGMTPADYRRSSPGQEG